jgi:hypothetical protein
MSDDFTRRNSADQEKKLDAEKMVLQGLDIYRQRVALAPNALRFRVVGNATYIGEAPPGTLDSSPAWRIKKILTSGSDFDILWANGTSDFLNIWNNWNSLTYS